MTWIDDGELLLHPIAKMLCQDIENAGHSLVLVSKDKVSGSAIFGDDTNTKIMENYVIRRKKRLNVRFQKEKKKNNLLARIDRRVIESINSIDKKITRFRAHKFVKIKSFLKGNIYVITKLNLGEVIIVSRAYLIPALLIRLAKDLIQRRKRFIIYYPFELYGHQKAKYSKTILFLEKIFLKKVPSLLITQNELREEYYRRKGYKGKSLVVRNYKRKMTPVEVDYAPCKKFRIVLVGLVDYGRGIEFLLEWTIKEKRNLHFTIIGKAHKRWLNEHRKIIDDALKAEVLTFYDPVPDHQLKSKIGDFDAGLIIYDETCKNHLFCAPSKLTDYLHAGLPVLASDLPAMRYYRDRFAFVKVFQNTADNSFEEAVRLLKAYRSRSQHQEIARVTNVLCWENESEKILHQIKIWLSANVKQGD